eukprot:13870358-Alexandrium_andersonii.AAC.3
MTGTKAGAVANPWLAAQRQCAKLYREGKQAGAKEAPTAAAKPPCACKERSKAEKTREVDSE